jgi:hypothetical protein
MRWRVVWALLVTMLSRSPTSAFMSVDLPTLGLPMMLTKPARWGFVSGFTMDGFDNQGRKGTDYQGQ